MFEQIFINQIHNNTKLVFKREAFQKTENVALEFILVLRSNHAFPGII